MIELFNTKPCSDYTDYSQAEGIITDKNFSVALYESLLKEMNFAVYTIGNPEQLICKRSDCLLLIKSDQTFNISQVKTENDLFQIIQNIADKIKSYSLKMKG